MGLNPAVSAIKEEYQRPFADAVKKFLGRHLGIKFALEKEEVCVQWNVDNILTPLPAENDQSRCCYCGQP